SFFFAWRNVLFSGAVIVTLALLRPVPLLGSGRTDFWLDVVGFLIAFAGQALRAAVIGFAYIKRGGKDGKVFANRLVTAGFFRHCRNPLYVGNLLVVTGIVVVHNHPWAYLLLPVAGFGYAAIVAAEEAYLASRFGEEYAEYCRRVPRWVPDFRGLRASLEGMEFNWRRVINKEYTTAYSWLAGMLALFAYQVLIQPAMPHRAAYLRDLALVLLVLTLAWAVIRYFKKTERARERRRLAAADGTPRG
ncbi:MAG TPA: isoprenylcysteine carboxylmethyltransferase family protein, partial [Armatimonadota bacterium]|nr:isoprenylcysteine carboxylmethyltransferase family protein [Armatimonadota bacterium]